MNETVINCNWIFGGGFSYMAQKALERSTFGVAGRAIKKRKTEIWLESLILERDRLDYLLFGKGS